MLSRICRSFYRHTGHVFKKSYSRKVFIEIYGCQMNSNDAEIVYGILGQSTKPVYEKCNELEKADIVLLMTCSIRENAESKIWNRLQFLKSFENTYKRNLTVGVLGCMAERLKSEFLNRNKTVDLVCGPDAYRDLPNLLIGAENEKNRNSNINVDLSIDETYGDIIPGRIDPDKKSAFVSIMRGCNNMCAFCIVPFVRGRERSRSMDSIVEEVRHLVDQGIKEITLLGQNVNSYCDETIYSNASVDSSKLSNNGFNNVYKAKRYGAKFVDLLEKISHIAIDTRFRFTSPHPKDFPDPLLNLIKSRDNICKQIHIPAQSGSSAVLERMRRGYTRDVYIELIHRIREIIPNVTLSSDFISGFVGETEQDHLQTLDLIQSVGYDMAYMYAYSMREKTMAHRRYNDDVPEEVKQRRLREVIDTFYNRLKDVNKKFIGTRQLVLIEGSSKKDKARLQGRSDGNKSIILESEHTSLKPGDYVETDIIGLSNNSLIGRYVRNSSISDFI